MSKHSIYVTFVKLNKLLQGNHLRLPKRCLAYQSNKTPQKDIDDNEPIKFTTSKAASFQSSREESVKWKHRPWYEALSLHLSIISVLVYFTILREENDLDQNFHFLDDIYARIDEAYRRK